MLTAESVWTESAGTASGFRVMTSPLWLKQSSVKCIEQMEDRSRGCQFGRPVAFNHFANRVAL